MVKPENHLKCSIKFRRLYVVVIVAVLNTERSLTNISRDEKKKKKKIARRVSE